MSGTLSCVLPTEPHLCLGSWQCQARPCVLVTRGLKTVSLRWPLFPAQGPTPGPTMEGTLQGPLRTHPAPCRAQPKAPP